MSDPLDRDRGRLRPFGFGAYVPPATAALLSLDGDACHWPLGEVESETFRFCRAPRDRGCYCGAHRRLALRGRQ